MEVVADISKELEYEKQKRATRDDIGLVIMEGLTQEQIRKEAQELYRAEREKTVLRPFTEKYPKIEPAESYRIQLALIEMKKAEGAKVVGKKIGRTSKAMPKMLNVDQPDYGHILDGMVLQDGVVFRRRADSTEDRTCGQEDMIVEVAMMLAEKQKQSVM